MTAKHSTPKDDENDPKISAPACVTVEEIKDIQDGIHRIETALVGDMKMGHRGLVQRMFTAERMIMILAFAVVILGGEKIVKMLL